MMENLEKKYGVDLKTAVHITPTLHDRYRGKSAYEIAVEYGYTGTEEEFATFLVNSAEYARQAKEAMEAAAASEQEAHASEAEVKRIEAELRSVVQAANQAIANTNKAIQAADGVAAEARAAAQQASNAATTATNAAAQAAQTASDAAAQAVQTAETAAQNAADLAGEAKREAEEATATANQAAEDAQEALSGANAAIAQMTPVREAAETAAAAAETATANAESATEAALAAAKRAEDAAGKNLPLATTTTHGVVKIGENLTITEDGTLSAQNSYELPVATEETLGGIKVGERLTISEDGMLSADVQETDLSGVEGRLDDVEHDISELPDTYAPIGHVSDTVKHVTSDERTKWNASQDIVSDAYSASKTYHLGDYCIYNNHLWKAKGTFQDAAPVAANSLYWEEVKIADEIKHALLDKEWQSVIGQSQYVSTSYGYAGYCIHNGFLIFSCADITIDFNASQKQEVTICTVEIPTGYKALPSIQSRVAWVTNGNTNGGSAWFTNSNNTIRIFDPKVNRDVIGGFTIIVPIVKA